MIQSIEHESVVIRGARVIDPYAGRDERADVGIADGRIVEDAPRGAAVIDGDGLIVGPGLMDIHVHLREPGQEHKETIETGTAAAAAGGFTFVACMPNTTPPLDVAERVRFVRAKAAEVRYGAVGPVAAITQGRGGRELTDFATLKEAGAVALSDDGTGVEDDGVMRAAFERAAQLGVVLVQHCEYRSISAGGVIHQGKIAARLGLPGLDPASEEKMIERDIALARETGGRYHVAHISTARAVELVRRAKAEGVPVTAEVCTHHLLLTHEACSGGDPNTKMHPPLRTAADVQACRHGLLDGTIDCIVTDHAPHTAEEKAVGFLKAPPGIVGLETAVGLAARAMIASGLADWPDVIGWFTRGASAVLGMAARPIAVGAVADVTIIDPHMEWIVEPSRFASRGRNTPFGGWSLTGQAVGTIRGRQVLTRTDSPLRVS